MTTGLRCPTCDSRQPSMHPAVGGGGEVTSFCSDGFHAPTVEACPSKLQVTADITVPCLIPLDGPSHSRTTLYHQGVHGGLAYVWSGRESAMIDTCRRCDDHARADEFALKLAVVVAP